LRAAIDESSAKPINLSQTFFSSFFQTIEENNSSCVGIERESY